MKRLKPCILLLLGLLSLPLQAEEKGRISRLGDRLKNVEIRNAKNEPMMLPGFGKQPILIFYADPDHPACDFTDYLEGDHYFHTAYPGHNLVRAKSQLALARSILDELPAE